MERRVGPFGRMGHDDGAIRKPGRPSKREALTQHPRRAASHSDPLELAAGQARLRGKPHPLTVR